MNNERKDKSDESLQSKKKRTERKKFYWILTAGFLLAVSVAAVVLLAWPSRTERFRRNMLESIEKNDYNQYNETMDNLKFNGSDKMYDFRNEEEKLALQKAQTLILQIWLKDDEVLWNDEELEKRTVGGVIYFSGSYGSEMAESEEGFELVKKAIEKLEKKYPSGPNSEMFISRDKDGKVAVGSRSYSRRTRP
jgi:hypothetical protein